MNRKGLGPGTTYAVRKRNVPYDSYLGPSDPTPDGSLWSL